MLRKIYVWEFPMRLTHWVIFLAITALCITGYYIGSPFIHSPAGESFTMANMRFAHLVSAYIFIVAFLVRVYWGFVGNRYSRWREYVPHNREEWRGIIDEVGFYVFIVKWHKACVGHCAWAAFVYLLLYVVFVLEILSGFALYAQSHYGWTFTLMGGWIFPYISIPTIRLFHHSVMWLLIIFTITHVYIGWFFDLTERNFVMGSIFSGYKTTDEP